MALRSSPERSALLRRMQARLLNHERDIGSGLGDRPQPIAAEKFDRIHQENGPTKTGDRAVVEFHHRWDNLAGDTQISGVRGVTLGIGKQKIGWGGRDRQVAKTRRLSEIEDARDATGDQLGPQSSPRDSIDTACDDDIGSQPAGKCSEAIFRHRTSPRREIGRGVERQPTTQETLRGK